MAREVVFPKFFENDLKSLENVYICLKRLLSADFPIMRRLLPLFFLQINDGEMC